MQQVSSGDTFFVYNTNYKAYAARNPYFSTSDDVYGFVSGETATIIKYGYTYNGSSGLLTPSSGLINTGDIVTLGFPGNQLWYIDQNSNPVFLDNIVINTASGQNQICNESVTTDNHNLTDQGDATWTFVDTNGFGYISTNGQVNTPTSPLYYNTNYFIQNIGRNMCSSNVVNMFEYIQSVGQNDAFKIEAPPSSANDYPVGDTTFMFQLVKPQIIYSGYYITLLNVYNRQFVYQQGLGGDDNTYGFTSTVSPNEQYATFLIKKYNPSNSTFYDTTTPIYFGDLFCLFGLGPGGLVGLFQSPTVATNNIISNTGLTVINPSQVCNTNAGANYALYVFVDPTTGTGNLASASVGTIPINYGQGLYIQNVGQFACQSTNAYLNAGTNISTNLNLSTISDPYPNPDDNNTNNYTFILYNQYFTAFFTPSNPVQSNSCNNNPNPFTCTTDNDIDCGCQNPFGIGTAINDAGYFITTYIGIVIVVGVLILIGIFILIIYEATKKKKPKTT